MTTTPDPSTLVPWPKPWPPAPAFLRCPDCDSVPDVRGSADLTAMYLYVVHSPTCPVWSGDGPELALAMLP